MRWGSFAFMCPHIGHGHRTYGKSFPVLRVFLIPVLYGVGNAICCCQTITAVMLSQAENCVRFCCLDSQVSLNSGTLWFRAFSQSGIMLWGGQGLIVCLDMMRIDTGQWLVQTDCFVKMFLIFDCYKLKFLYIICIQNQLIFASKRIFYYYFQLFCIILILQLCWIFRSDI